MDLNKKRVLIFIDWYYPAFKAGGPIQSVYNIVSNLSEEFDFFIITSDKDLGENNSLPGVIFNKWIIGNYGEKIFYLKDIKSYNSIIKRLVLEVRPEVVYLNSMFSIKYTIQPLLVLRKLHFQGKIIIAPRGMLHKGALQYKSLKKKMFLFGIKALGLTRDLIFQATDDQEQKDISLYFKNPIFLIPNLPKQIQERQVINKNKKCNDLSLVFVSRVSPKKNLLFICKVLSKIGFEKTVHLHVAGQVEDDNYFEQCKFLLSGSRVNLVYHGAIPNERIIEFLMQFHFFVLPTYGENFGHSIFESFLAGLPVIISDQTPWKDLEEKNIGWDISLHDEAKWIDVLYKVYLMNSDEYYKMSLSSIEFSRKYLKSNESRGKYIKIFQG